VTGAEGFDVTAPAIRRGGSAADAAAHTEIAEIEAAHARTFTIPRAGREGGGSAMPPNMPRFTGAKPWAGTKFVVVIIYP